MTISLPAAGTTTTLTHKFGSPIHGSITAMSGMFYASRAVVILALVLLISITASAQRTPPHRKAPTKSSSKSARRPIPKKTAHGKPSPKTKAHSKPVPYKPTRRTATREPQAPTHSYAVTQIPEDETAGPVAPTGSPFLYANNLAPFFTALSAQQQHLPDAPETIRVLQFGDSHTAADIFSGAVRAALQAQFGDGGLGFQYPGHPFAGYHLAGSTRAQTSGWQTQGNHFNDLGDTQTGLGGIAISTSRPGESITLTTSCTTFQLHFLRQPGGGRLSFTDNTVYISDIDTANQPDAAGVTATSSTAGTFTYACTAGSHDFTLTTLDDAPVRLFGLVTEQPGVTWEQAGINGAVAPLMLRWNQTLFAEYLRQRNPNLIVLAYGTNEAAFYSDDYPTKFARLLDTLHQYVPAAAILVLGPYDRATSVSVRLSRRRRRVYWHTFAGTQRIIADQEAVCRTHHCTFYNEQARMGGPGSMLHWAASGLAQPDHTHLTGTGYRSLAAALYDDLISAYKSYQQSTTQP